MSAKQGGYNNTQVLGDGNYITNNLVGSLSIAPKDFEIKAIVNHTWILVAIAIVVISIIYGILKFFAIVFPQSYNYIGYAVLLLYAFLLPSGIMLFEKLTYYFSGTHVKYNNGVFTVNGISREFYREIWDIKYKPLLFRDGAVLTIYGVNAVKNRPYKNTIKFMRDSDAKYIYDSFWNRERIERFNRIE